MLTTPAAAQHHCNPLIVPSNSSMQFYCRLHPQNDVFLCYFRCRCGALLQCAMFADGVHNAQTAHEGGNRAAVHHRHLCLRRYGAQHADAQHAPRLLDGVRLLLLCMHAHSGSQRHAPHVGRNGDAAGHDGARDHFAFV
jgi:hypothetical protein